MMSIKKAPSEIVQVILDGASFSCQNRINFTRMVKSFGG